MRKRSDGVAERVDEGADTAMAGLVERGTYPALKTY
jgi:hypothetical protein